ncbi:15876_t:CDS:1, partial [Racocetra persica]
QTIPLIPQQFTVPPSVATSSRCVATRRSKFCEIWGLARQAAQLAVDCDDNEMIQWLRTFINQKKHCLTQTDECENSDKENDLTVANLLITKHKGRPGTKRYKAAKRNQVVNHILAVVVVKLGIIARDVKRKV